MKEIKFRAWHKHPIKGFVMSEVLNIEFSSNSINTVNGSFPNLKDESILKLMQYTGRKINDSDVYESDIIREENETEDNVEIYYSVVTWIEEWCMFACLVIKRDFNEYENYIQNGAEALDESMFWTFPLQNEEYGKRFLAGNIYSNPELLKPSHDR